MYTREPACFASMSRYPLKSNGILGMYFRFAKISKQTNQLNELLYGSRKQISCKLSALELFGSAYGLLRGKKSHRKRRTQNCQTPPKRIYFAPNN